MEVSRLSGGWLEEMPFVLRSDWAISGEYGSNGPCWKVLQEQIWRRHPVNKEPAETSCEQNGTEMCDFKRGLLVTDSWWSVYHFPRSYCYWIWCWRKLESSGRENMRKLRSRCSFFVHLGLCFGLWIDLIPLFQDLLLECFASDETWNYNGFWFALGTVLRCMCHFQTDEAEHRLNHP